MRFFIVRLLCPVLVLLVLAGCDNYPDKWIAVDHPLFSNCANINGTYRIGSNDENGLGMSANMDDTFFRTILPPPTMQRWHWETMTISGDASQQLDITLMRSEQTMDAYLQREFEKGSKNYYRNRYNTMQNPATRWEGAFAQMTDDEYEANLDKLYLAPQKHIVLKRDKDYVCSRGWISSERLRHDPGPDRNNLRPDVVDGISRFGKDKAGFLVAESIYREGQQFNVWCGDGCKGVSLGTWTIHNWRHWEPAAPAWQSERARPWAEPFKGTESASIDNDIRGLLRLPEVRRLVTPTIVEPASLESLDPSGKDVIMSVSSPTTTLLNTMFKGLGRVFTFYDVRVIELTQKPQGGWNMRMLLVLRPRE